MIHERLNIQLPVLWRSFIAVVMTDLAVAFVAALTRENFLGVRVGGIFDSCLDAVYTSALRGFGRGVEMHSCVQTDTSWLPSRSETF